MEKRQYNQRKENFLNLSDEKKGLIADALSVFMFKFAEELNSIACNGEKRHNTVLRLKWLQLRNALYKDMQKGQFVFATSNIEGIAEKWKGFDKDVDIISIIYNAMPKNVFFEASRFESNCIYMAHKDLGMDCELLGKISYDDFGGIKEVVTDYKEDESTIGVKDKREKGIKLIASQMFKRQNIIQKSKAIKVEHTREK